MIKGGLYYDGSSTKSFRQKVSESCDLFKKHYCFLPDFILLHPEDGKKFSMPEGKITVGGHEMTVRFNSSILTGAIGLGVVVSSQYDPVLPKEDSPVVSAFVQHTQKVGVR